MCLNHTTFSIHPTHETKSHEKKTKQPTVSENLCFNENSCVCIWRPKSWGTMYTSHRESSDIGFTDLYR